jgi:hypothetical protein
MTEITTLELGLPGPAGVGITAAEKNALAPKASPTFTGTVTLPTTNVTGTFSTEGATNLGNGSTDVTTITGQIRTAGSAPTIAEGASAGTGATASLIHGDDTNGAVQVNTGTGAGTGSLILFTFNQARSNANYAVLLTAREVDAASLKVYVPDDQRSSAGFKIYNDTDTPDSTSFAWDYFVIGKS